MSNRPRRPWSSRCQLDTSCTGCHSLSSIPRRTACTRSARRWALCPRGMAGTARPSRTPFHVRTSRTRPPWPACPPGTRRTRRLRPQRRSWRCCTTRTARYPAARTRPSGSSRRKRRLGARRFREGSAYSRLRPLVPCLARDTRATGACTGRIVSGRGRGSSRRGRLRWPGHRDRGGIDRARWHTGPARPATRLPHRRYQASLCMHSDTLRVCLRVWEAVEHPQDHRHIQPPYARQSMSH